MVSSLDINAFQPCSSSFEIKDHDNKGDGKYIIDENQKKIFQYKSGDCQMRYDSHGPSQIFTSSHPSIQVWNPTQTGAYVDLISRQFDTALINLTHLTSVTDYSNYFGSKQYVALGLKKGGVRVFNSEGFACKKFDSNKPVISLNSEDRFIYVGYKDEVQVNDINQAMPIFQLSLNYSLTSLQPFPKEGKFITSDNQGEIHIYDLRTNKKPIIKKHHSTTISCVKVCADFFVSGDLKGKICIHDHWSVDPIETIQLNKTPPYSYISDLYFDRTQLISVTCHGEINRWDFINKCIASYQLNLEKNHFNNYRLTWSEEEKKIFCLNTQHVYEIEIGKPADKKIGEPSDKKIGEPSSDKKKEGRIKATLKRIISK